MEEKLYQTYPIYNDSWGQVRDHALGNLQDTLQIALKLAYFKDNHKFAYSQTLWRTSGQELPHKRTILK